MATEILPSERNGGLRRKCVYDRSRAERGGGRTLTPTGPATVRLSDRASVVDRPPQISTSMPTLQL